MSPIITVFPKDHRIWLELTVIHWRLQYFTKDNRITLQITVFCRRLQYFTEDNRISPKLTIFYWRTPHFTVDHWILPQILNFWRRALHSTADHRILLHKKEPPCFYRRLPFYRFSQGTQCAGAFIGVLTRDSCTLNNFYFYRWLF